VCVRNCQKLWIKQRALSTIDAWRTKRLTNVQGALSFSLLFTSLPILMASWWSWKWNHWMVIFHSDNSVTMWFDLHADSSRSFCSHFTFHLQKSFFRLALSFYEFFSIVSHLLLALKLFPPLSWCCLFNHDLTQSLVLPFILFRSAQLSLLSAFNKSAGLNFRLNDGYEFPTEKHIAHLPFPHFPIFILSYTHTFFTFKRFL